MVIPVPWEKGCVVDVLFMAVRSAVVIPGRRGVVEMSVRGCVCHVFSGNKPVVSLSVIHNLLGKKKLL